MGQMRVHGQVCLDRRNIYSTEKLVNIRIEWIICYVCMYVCMWRGFIFRTVSWLRLFFARRHSVAS